MKVKINNKRYRRQGLLIDKEKKYRNKITITPDGKIKIKRVRNPETRHSRKRIHIITEEKDEAIF